MPVKNAAPLKKNTLLLMLSLNLIAGALLYANTFHAGFHFDGAGSLRDNPRLRPPYPLTETCGGDNLTRCLTHITFALNARLHGLAPQGYHAVNTAIHIGASLALFWLILLIFQTPRGRTLADPRRAALIAWSASLIFLCHPLQTQAVTYIWQRFASLAALFYILTAALYLHARIRASAKSFCLAGLSFLAAVFSKETAATLPVMLAVSEFLFFPFAASRKKTILAALILGAAALLIPAAVLLSGKLAFYLKPHTYYGLEAPFGWDYAMTQINVVRTYLRLAVLPTAQNLDYDYPVSRTFFEMGTLLSFLLHAVLLAAAFLMRRRAPLLSWGIVWFYVTLSVESSFLPIRDVIFEHRVYLPLAGFAAAAAWSLNLLLRRERLFLASVLTLCAVLSVLTIRRNEIWRSEIRLWEDVVQKSPKKFRGYSQLCRAWKEAGDLPKAVSYCEKSIALNPKNAVAYNNLGSLYGELGRFDDALKTFHAGLALKGRSAPDREAAGRLHNNLGNAYLSQKSFSEALAHYEKALSFDPLNDLAHFNRARAALAAGQLPLARAEFEILTQLGAYGLAGKIQELLNSVEGTAP